MSIVNVCNDTFAASVGGEDQKPVLVDFYAPWCGPCQTLSPVLDQLAEEMGERVKICKVNIDDSPDLAVNYGVRSVPTLMIFQGGEKKSVKSGFQSKTDLTNWLNNYLNV